MTIKEYVANRKQEIKNELANRNDLPHLAIVQLNDDAASNAYVKGKLKDAAELGVIADLLKFPVETTEAQLLKIIDELNNDDSIDGFIVQMPLPKGIDEEKIKLAVSPKKRCRWLSPIITFKPMHSTRNY